MSASRGADVPVSRGLNRSICQCRRYRYFPRSRCCSRVRPDLNGTWDDHCSVLDSSHLPDGRLSPVSLAPPRNSSPIDSERSDESFHSVADSPAIRTPVSEPGPVLAPCSGSAGPAN